MTNNRTWVFGGIAAMLVLAIGGWMLGISPILSQTALVSAQTATIQAANTKSAADLASLKQQFVHIGKLRAKLDTLRGSIPETASTSVFLSELTSLAAQYGVTLISVTVGTATLYTVPTTAPPAAATSSTSTPTPSPTAAAPAPTTPAPVVGAGLVLVPMIISATGSFDAVSSFDGAVQTGTRLFFASISNIGTDQSGSATGTLTGDAFTLQGTSDVVTQPKLSATPTPTATPTATPTPTPTSTASKAGASVPQSTPTPTPTPTST